MKRIAALMLLASAMVTDVRACDVCGCSASNQYLGVLPQYQKNFIGIQYLYNSFESNHPSLFEGKPNEHSDDQYHTVQLWGRYNLGKRIQIFGFAPYRVNTQVVDEASNKNSGIGDISFLVNAIIIKEKEDGNPWKQQLIAGAGLKLPTGSYTGITAQDRQGIPNMQPGTGSWDVVMNANYTIRHEKTGINADAAYTMTTANHEKYKYGNRTTAGILGFYTVKVKTISVLPQLGVRYEYALHDYDNFSRKWLNEQSGGHMMFATAGIQAYYKQWGLRCTYQLPIDQYYGNGYVTAKQKIDAGLIFLF